MPFLFCKISDTICGAFGGMLTGRKTWYGISEIEMFALASILFFIMPHVIFSCDTQQEFNVLLSTHKHEKGNFKK
jgi:hypothetical protein